MLTLFPEIDHCVGNKLNLTGCGDKDVGFPTYSTRRLKHLKGINVLDLTVHANFQPRRRFSVTNTNSQIDWRGIDENKQLHTLSANKLTCKPL